MTLVGKNKTVLTHVGCEKSFFLFSKQNVIRIKLYQFTMTAFFEYAILLLIALSSAKLVADTYVGDVNPTA
jgi:hypothetical protein